MSIEFDTPANRIISQFAPKNKFRIDTSLSDITFLRQLSVQGRLFYDFAAVASTSTAITRTPAVGSTEFYYATIVNGSGAGVNNNILFEFNNDGNLRLSLNANDTNPTQYIPFVDSLTGDGVKAFTVEATETGTGLGNVTLFGWTENTSRIRDVAT